MERRAFLMAGAALWPALARGTVSHSDPALLYVDRAGCPWCQRFERETMAAYVASPFGQQMPLVRVSLDDGQPKGVTLQEPVRFTPTFVLLSKGREYARIVGYQDNPTFFGLVERHIGDHRRSVGDSRS